MATELRVRLQQRALDAAVRTGARPLPFAVTECLEWTEEESQLAEDLDLVKETQTTGR